MKIKSVNTYPLSLLASLVVLYLIANDQHGWYIYILLGFVILERAFLHLALKLVAYAQKKIATAMAENMQQILTQARAQGLAHPHVEDDGSEPA